MIERPEPVYEALARIAESDYTALLDKRMIHGYMSEIEDRVEELENENRILKNEIDDLRSFSRLCHDSAKRILGITLK